MKRHLYYYDDPKNENKNSLISVKTHFVSGGRIMNSSPRNPKIIKSEIDSILKKLAEKGI